MGAGGSLRSVNNGCCWVWVMVENLEKMKGNDPPPTKKEKPSREEGLLGLKKEGGLRGGFVILQAWENWDRTGGGVVRTGVGTGCSKGGTEEDVEDA